MMGSDTPQSNDLYSAVHLPATNTYVKITRNTFTNITRMLRKF